MAECRGRANARHIPGAGPPPSTCAATAVGYLLRVNFFEAVLVFVGIPALVIIVVALVTVVPARSKARPKYSPGGRWEYSDRFYSGDTAVDVPSHVTDASLGGARGSW